MFEFRKRFSPKAITALLAASGKEDNDSGNDNCISQPWVRPIVRGKAHGNTECGAKLHISMVNGYAKIEHLSLMQTIIF